MRWKWLGKIEEGKLETIWRRKLVEKIGRFEKKCKWKNCEENLENNKKLGNLKNGNIGNKIGKRKLGKIWRRQIWKKNVKKTNYDKWEDLEKKKCEEIHCEKREE